MIGTFRAEVSPLIAEARRAAPFAALDMIASNAWTRARLGWEPTGPDLLTDLAAMDYSALTED